MFDKLTMTFVEPVLNKVEGNDKASAAADRMIILLCRYCLIFFIVTENILKVFHCFKR